MKVKRRASADANPVPTREAFATFTEFKSAALNFWISGATAAGLDEQARAHFLFCLPESEEDWIEWKTTAYRRWWAGVPLLTGDPPPERLAQVADAARRRFAEHGPDVNKREWPIA